MLSASAHCRSSIQITSDRRVASRPSSARKRLERAAPDAKRIDALALVSRHGVGDGVDLQQHGKDARSSARHIGRQQPLDSARGIDSR